MRGIKDLLALPKKIHLYLVIGIVELLANGVEMMIENVMQRLI